MNRYILFLLTLSLFTLSACDSPAPTGVGPTPEKPDPEPPPSNGSETTVAIDGRQNGAVVDLSWKTRSAPNDPTFDLYRGSTADFDTTGRLFVTITDSTYQDGEVEEDRTYHYKVAVRGTKALSDPASIRIIDEFSPDPVSNLNAAGGFYRAELSWDSSPSDDVDGYYVYRSTEAFQSASEASRLTPDPIQSIKYTDDEALDGTRYYYRVAAVDDARNLSGMSEQVAATPTFSGDPLQGKRVWNDECSTCHVNGDAWDLQAFAMPDTMIHRRSLGHVSHDEALDIISFVHSQDVEPFQDARFGKKEMPLFQPGNRILSSDREFAVNLFGEDQWPEDLTIRGLKRLKPSQIPIPFRFPEWNDESNKHDWVPHVKLVSRISENNQFVDARNRYNLNPTDENLVRLSRAFYEASRGTADRHPFGNHTASSETEMKEILELNRWMASKTAVHFMRKRYGYDEIESFLEGKVDGKPIHRGKDSPVRYWWVVGDLMRSSNAYDVTSLPSEYGSTKQLLEEGSKWFYLSWAANPELSFDTGTTYFIEMVGSHFDKPRLAAYIAAYMITTSDLGLNSIWNLLFRIPKDTPDHWNSNYIRFVLESYENRIERGDYIKNEHDIIRNRVRDGLNEIIQSNSLSDSDKSFVRNKKTFLLNWINEQERIHG